MRCMENNLILNINTTKQVIEDFHKSGTTPPLHIDGAAVEMVSSFMYLGVQLTNTLTWCINTSRIIKKAHQHLYFLRKLKSFHGCVVESTLTPCITVWYASCTVAKGTAEGGKLHKGPPHAAYHPFPTFTPVNAKTRQPASLETPSTLHTDCLPSCPQARGCTASCQRTQNWGTVSLLMLSDCWTAQHFHAKPQNYGRSLIVAHNVTFAWLLLSLFNMLLSFLLS